MDRAFIVIGAESSGTRMLTDILIRAGCIGESTHSQKWDFKKISGSPIVWRRSVPYQQKEVDIKEMINRLPNYEIRILVIVRDYHSTIRSSVRRGHVNDLETSVGRMRKAYCSIFSQLQYIDLPFYVVSYENLCLNNHFINVLLSEHNLNKIKKYRVRNENSKYCN